MKKKNQLRYDLKIKILISLVAVLATVFLVLITNQRSEHLEVIFFDVGQGDSILIKTPRRLGSQNILIDGGPDNTVVYKLGKYLPFFDRNIDLMILTHPHADHVTGLIEVLKRYQVKQVMLTGILHTLPQYINWLEIIREKEIKTIIIDKPKIFNMGEDLKLEILSPKDSLAGEKIDNLNNSSIVTKLIFNQFKVLLTGDAEAEVEKILLGDKFDLKTNILKVAHQGSSDASSLEFLKAVSPQLAIISVGSNKFGHPSFRILKRLERLGIEILRTDKVGDIVIFSDGQKWWQNNN